MKHDAKFVKAAGGDSKAKKMWVAPHLHAYDIAGVTALVGTPIPTTPDTPKGLAGSVAS